MDGVVLFVIVALIAFFFLKYFSAESPPAGTDSEFTWVTRNIDQVLVMFPNAMQAAVAFELSKSRSVELTIEKLLSGQHLPAPPTDSRYHGWSSHYAGSDLASAQTSYTTSSEPTKEDLIKRYNLQNRIYASQPSTSEEKYAWSKKREEREEMLKRRKEAAVLAARSKLMEKDGLK